MPGGAGTKIGSKNGPHFGVGNRFKNTFHEMLFFPPPGVSRACPGQVLGGFFLGWSWMRALLGGLGVCGQAREQASGLGWAASGLCRDALVGLAEDGPVPPPGQVMSGPGWWWLTLGRHSLQVVPLAGPEQIYAAEIGAEVAFGARGHGRSAALRTLHVHAMARGSLARDVMEAWCQVLCTFSTAALHLPLVLIIRRNSVWKLWRTACAPRCNVCTGRLHAGALLASRRRARARAAQSHGHSKGLNFASSHVVATLRWNCRRSSLRSSMHV